MNTPSLIYGFLLSTLYGAIFHLWRGGNFARLLYYVVLGWVGFWIGHFLGGQLGWNFFRFGSLNLGAATLISLAFLGLGYWLSLIEIERK